MPRRKSKQEPPDKGYPSLIDWANGLTFWTVQGMMLGKIAHKGKERCEDCGAKPKALHFVGCKLEESPCGAHLTCWECDCEFYKEDGSR